MIVMDTSAWMEYLLDTYNAEEIQGYLSNEKILTPSIVLVELSCKSVKEKWDFEKVLKFIKSKSFVAPLNEKIIIECGKIYDEKRKKKGSFGMADSIILSTAKENNAKILTKDNDFRGLNEVIMLK